MFSDRNQNTALKKLKVSLFFLNFMYVWPIRYCTAHFYTLKLQQLEYDTLHQYELQNQKTLYTIGFECKGLKKCLCYWDLKKTQAIKPTTPTLILHDPIKNTKKVRCLCIQNNDTLASNSNSIISTRLLVKASRKNWFGNGSRYKSFTSEGVPYKISVCVSS